MTEKVISSLHIQKLGHEIQEIRERALINISSKLEHGFVYDNDLARSREILTKLFEWFLFNPCSKQPLVFSLIKRILKSESGKTLINHHGTAVFKNELVKIRTFIEPKYYPHLDEILQILNESNVIVPPLETEVPLSYRTGTDYNNCDRLVGTTATTIEGFVQQDASAHNQYGLQNASHTYRPINILTYLKWQSLIEPDRHVLQSIENSLRDPPHPSSLLHSSDFFNNILLHDFPAEVFLQRPMIVNIFYDLVLSCPSTRVKTSVLNCLCNLTKALQVRINCYNDPCMCNSKEKYSQVSSRCSSPSGNSSSNENTERPENSDYLKTQQMSLPNYCFYTFKCIFKYLCVKPDSIQSVRQKNNQRGINTALILLDELVTLLKLLVNEQVWFQDCNQDFCKEINDILIGYGTTLEYFRVEAADDSNINSRVIQLCFLHNCANFLLKLVPLSQTGLILPRNLKNALTHSLVDVILTKLYPELYNTLLQYVQSFRAGIDSDSLIKYHETSKICDSMTSAVQFMKTCKSLNAVEGIHLAKKALPCLEFHKSESFVKLVVELCANKLPLYPYDDELLEKFEFVVLKLLAHNVEEIKQEMYRLCQKRVIAAVGPKLNTSCIGVPGAQILFLLKSKILIEIACHGITSGNVQIRNNSEDILIHIIKCKILVSEDIWNRVMEALIGALPILLCHANKNTSLGRSLLNIIDPDIAQSVHLPKIEVIKGNIHVLFGSDVSMREEAFSRLCWMLASQPDSRDMLPRLNNLYDKALPNVCQIQRALDVNKIRTMQHFYQPSSLQQVLDLLKSPDVEPVIRRSALTQTSVMMEDPLLHGVFLEKNGLEIVQNVIKSALVEKNFTDYPDSVIPAISVLKNICLYHSSARHSLCVNSDIYYNILRSLFLFFTEDKVKYDAVCLLFLLIFNDFIKGSPSKADFSVPYLITQQLHVPFSCNTHWEISPYYDASLVALLSGDRWCLSSVQIQWNLEMFGGLDELLSWDRIRYVKNDVDILKLRDYDLQCLKASSVDYYVTKYLSDVQNAVTHENVIGAINKLTSYIILYGNTSREGNFLLHPWEDTFTRFLKLLPSSEEDAKLLNSVLKFLKLLVPFYKSSLWLSQVLNSSTNCLLDLITLEPSADEEFKILSQDLLALITSCSCHEQHFLDYYPCAKLSDNETPPWTSVVEIIANNVQCNGNFYNLAYLDSLLACLVRLSAHLGWSNSKSGSLPKRIFSRLVTSLCELVVVFHCGKGPTAAISLMGLSITRHVIMILNHVIAEMHHSKIKNWESCFLDVEEENWLKSFLVLWWSRDVVVRAATLQFFAGLAKSSLLAINIVNELKNERQGVWHLALNVLIDRDEASIVKENSAYLLANLMRHTCPNSSNKNTLVTSLVPNTMKKGKDDVNTIFDLFDDYRFNKNLTTILNELYTINIDFESKSVTHLLEYYSPKENEYYNDDSSSSKSSNKSQSTSVVTPSFVKSLVNVLLALFNLDEARLSHKLQDFGLVKLLFRCICNPSMSITDTKKLSLYCEILEMDIAICSLLGHVAHGNQVCLGTLLHTRDCLNGVIALLDPSIYHTHLPQLIYLRNSLWSEIFKLISVLTMFDAPEKSGICDEAVKIIAETVYEAGRESFVETLCEATRCNSFDDLQNSALLSLTSLLGVESQRVFKITNGSREFSEGSSIQNLLDTVHTSRTTILEKPNKSDDSILEEVFFKDSGRSVITEDLDDGIAGAQLCKILLNLYDLCNLKVSKDLLRKKTMITSSLTSILCVSQEAKRFALKSGLLSVIMKQLKDFYIKLSLESVDCLRKVADKKRVCPILEELNEVIGLITNFMVGNDEIKCRFAELGLSDLVHKLWIWFLLQKLHLFHVLKMLCTFTTDCSAACQSLTLTSSVAGSGLRKAPSKISLLHAIINLIEKEMDQVSKTHNLSVLELSFIIMSNCCTVTECRMTFCKTTLLNSVTRLHPAITKKQKPWDSVELIWLEFLQNFSLHPEGQSCIAKVNDVFEILLALSYSSKSTNRIMALLVLRNVSFYQPNRSRLLTSDEFLNLLKNKLESGNADEKSTVVLIMWSLAANNQKAKIAFKAAQLDLKLQQVLKQYQLSNGDFISNDEIDRMEYVLNVIMDGDKIL